MCSVLNMRCAGVDGIYVFVVDVFMVDIFIVDVVRWLLVLPFYIKKFFKVKSWPDMAKRGAEVGDGEWF